MTLARDISVVIPVYNRRDQVVEAIESVVTQTGFDLQILLADDASTDGTSEALAHLVHKGYPLTVVRHDANRGVSAARNSALAMATMPLVCFLDSDDLLLPGALEALWSLLDTRPDVQLAHGLREDVVTSPGTVASAHAKTLPPDTMMISGILMRADLVRSLGPFDEGFAVGEDVEWFSRIPWVRQRTAVHEGITLRRRVGDDNLTSDLDAMRRSRLAMVRKRLAGS